MVNSIYFETLNLNGTLMKLNMQKYDTKRFIAKFERSICRCSEKHLFLHVLLKRYWRDARVDDWAALEMR